jgi:hypothetical protein
MSDKICANCGRLTNTAVCQWTDPIRPDKKANKCYVAFENGKWVKGCAYDEADPIYEKPIFDKLILSTSKDNDSSPISFDSSEVEE